MNINPTSSIYTHDCTAGVGDLPCFATSFTSTMPNQTLISLYAYLFTLCNIIMTGVLMAPASIFCFCLNGCPSYKLVKSEVAITFCFKVCSAHNTALPKLEVPLQSIQSPQYGL